MEREKAAKDILDEWEKKTRLAKILEIKNKKKAPSRSQEVLERAKTKSRDWKVWRSRDEHDDDERLENEDDERLEKEEETIENIE